MKSQSFKPLWFFASIGIFCFFIMIFFFVIIIKPSMTSVVRMLEGKIPVQAPIINRGSMDQEARFKAFELLSQDSQTQVSTLSQSSQVQTSSISRDGPWVDSSYSLQSNDETKDLYPINADWPMEIRWKTPIYLRCNNILAAKRRNRFAGIARTSDWTIIVGTGTAFMLYKKKHI